MLISTSSSELPLVNGSFKADRDYWMNKLTGDPISSGLTTDYERAPGRADEKSRIAVNLDEELCRELLKLSNQSDFLLHTTLLAALHICLHKYTGGASVVTGSPGLRELDGLNVLPIVSVVDDRLTFRQFLLDTQRSLLEAYAWQSYPFASLLTDLNMNHSEDRCPLFDIVLQLQNIHGDLPELNNDITLVLAREDQQISGYIEFATRLFTRERIERFRGHLLNILDEALADTGKLISHLRLLTGEEREQILSHFNRTAHPLPSPLLLLPQLLQLQAASAPLAAALLCEHSSLSYLELDERSNQLAHLLRSRSIGPDSIVALCLHRSPQLVISILAVLKAGAAYLPLDPDLPQERLSFIINDARPALLICADDLIERLPSPLPPLCSLDAVEEQLAAASTEELPSLINPLNLAYVLYTSGSTGQPKAAMVTHLSLVNHMLWMQATYPLSPADCVLQKTPYSFDASVWEFFAPLLAGARLLMARAGGHQDAGYLIEQIRRHEVTVLQVVPSLLRMLVEEQGWRQCGSLRRVYYGGAPITRELQHRAEEGLGCQLINLYGPTETTIEVSSWVCERGAGGGAAGRPGGGAEQEPGVKWREQ